MAIDSLPHCPFPKIPRTLSDTPGAGSRWVATEKIHGAQLVVASDGTAVRFGKRKAWLGEQEAFFGWQLLRAPLEQAAMKLYLQLGEPGPVYLYGELFGGHYPHPDVPALPGMQAVQTGIWYAPTLGYAVFDIAVVRGGKLWFLAHSQVLELTAKAGFVSAPLLGRGNRGTLSKLPVRYPSTIPGLLGLPALADNIAEGFVLKPDVAMPAAKRPVVKHKIREFDEVRFGQSLPFDGGVHLSVAELTRWASEMINPARIASARSKVGELAAAVAEEVLLDVWIDLEAIFPRRMAGLSEADEQAFREALNQLAQEAQS